MNKLRLTDEEINKVKRGLCGLNNNHGCIQLLKAQLAHLAAVPDEEIVAGFLYDNFNTISKGTWEELSWFNETKQWWLAQGKILLSLIQPVLLAKAVKDEEIVEKVANQLSRYGQDIIFAIGEVIPPDKADWIAKRRLFIAKDILSLR